ncbi:MAG: NADP-dependent malic enzyme [bacterium]|nr:NADP-dependent malic enzyme [bacterium]
MDIRKMALELHAKQVGKLEIVSKVAITNREELSVAYTPGVAEPCKEIHKNPNDVYKYTIKGNFVAIVTDGTAVLGLGNIGPLAAMPVMEGKAILFKTFAGIDAIPICLNSDNVDEIVRTIELISPTFGGINLEDIAAPRCFEIERQLKNKLDIPVFHDDQHGTAVVVLAGLLNSLKLVEKSKSSVLVVINGAGSAGIAIAKLLLKDDFQNILLCDRAGILTPNNPMNNAEQEVMAQITNQACTSGSLAEALVGADIFIGVSAGGIVTAEMVKHMSSKAIVFAMANPTPEIMPDEALAGGAYIVGTGRSDFPNQINNVLAFPGIFRGALDVRAKDINEEMKLAAAYAIAAVLRDDELRRECIIPDPFDSRVVPAVARAVALAAQTSGVAKN